MKRRILCMVLATGFSSAVAAQEGRIELPLPENTDPVALGLMQGFPPPPGKIITLANTPKYPNALGIPSRICTTR